MKKLTIITLLVLIASVEHVTASATITVSVSPSTAQVTAGSHRQFTATVNGTSISVVSWNISGTGCQGQACGTITADGLYTAPATPPTPPTVTVTATSIMDANAFGTAIVTILPLSTVAVSVSPTSASVVVNGQQQFTATVTGTNNHAVNWTVSGLGCVATSCGTVDSTGLYTAPPTVPVPAFATVTATSIADPTKSASASVVIQSSSSISVSIFPTTAQVATGAHQQFTATVTGTSNMAVTWSVAGTGCRGPACGTISASGLYTAPSVVPNPPTVTVTATSVADPEKSASAVVTIGTGPSVTVQPPSAQVATGAQQQFTATVSGTNQTLVVWSVSGSGCSGVACGTVNSSGLYTAPAVAPVPPVVAVTATLLSMPSVSGSATVHITAQTRISVSVSPDGMQVGTGAQQQYTATVTGTTNHNVIWSISGIGCVSTTCGTITSGGLYTAPSLVPNPPFVNIVATSVVDSTKSGSALAIIVRMVSVAISPTTAQVPSGGQQQFTATVTGTTNHSVTWTVAGQGCGGAGCGTVTTNGLYTAPATLPNPPVVSVTATSQADPTKFASAIVTLVTPIIVTISPTRATVTVNGQQQFTATVTGTSDHGVLWSVQGTGCSQSACGSITSNGLYTAPANVPNPPLVTVTATSHADNSRQASAAVTIAPTSNSKLNGQYAFLFQGFDPLGPYQAAGSFTADGHGNLTGGLEDINRILGPVNSTIRGTYNISGDNRGTMQITTSLGTATYTFAINATGTAGRFIEFDNSGIQGSGSIVRQDPTAFNTAALTGGFALGLSGSDLGGGPIAALGAIFPSGSGFVAGSTLDVNDAGNVYPTFAPFQGVYAVDVTSRGSMTLTVAGLGSGTLNFAFYVVSINQILMVSKDPIFTNQFLLSGTGQAQTGSPYLSSSFQGHSVFHLTGFNGAFPETMVGRFGFDGAGNLINQFDRNSGGNITISSGYTGAYDLQLNGRGTFNLVDIQTGRPTIWLCYAIAPNRAFLMDASTGKASMGEMKDQILTPPFENSNVIGDYLFASGRMASPGLPVFSGIENFDGGNGLQGQGTFSGTEDENTQNALMPNQTVVGTYSISTLANNGRGTQLVTSPAPATIALWLISGSEFIGMDVDASDPQPSILFFQQ
jgi:hypothetical protein